MSRGHALSKYKFSQPSSVKKTSKRTVVNKSENKKPNERLKLRQKQLKDQAKMTRRLRRSKRIAQIKEEIKKSEVENDDTEINSNFPIYSKLKPLYKGKLTLEKNKELDGLNIEKLHVNKFCDANISMNESERVERNKKIIDKIIQKLPASSNYYVEHNKAKNSLL